jgi:hypothetical protein
VPSPRMAGQRLPSRHEAWFESSSLEGTDGVLAVIPMQQATELRRDAPSDRRGVGPFGRAYDRRVLTSPSGRRHLAVVDGVGPRPARAVVVVPARRERRPTRRRREGVVAVDEVVARAARDNVAAEVAPERVSSPGSPAMLSTPGPPNAVSAPWPPAMSSSPPNPISSSLPGPPASVSLPPMSPARTSSPGPPLSRSSSFPVRRQEWRHVCLVPDHDVGAGASVRVVVAALAADDVVAGTAVDLVHAGAAHDNVSTRRRARTEPTRRRRADQPRNVLRGGRACSDGAVPPCCP